MEKKVELSLVDKILSKVGLKAVEINLEQMKLDDNQTVVEAEVFEAGQPIVIVTEDEQKIALPVGEYGMEDGRIIVVQEEGIIFEIKEVATEEEEAEEEPVVASEKPTPAPVAKRVVESVSKESYFSKATEEEVIELIAKVVEMSIAKSKEVELSAVVEEEAPAPRVQNPERSEVALAGIKTGESITDFLNRINK